MTLGSETLTINSNVSTVYYFGGDIAGTGGVTVAGTYLTFGPVFNGTNTYTGATTVSTGTLGLYGTGSIADSSGVAVASGAYFDISAPAPESQFKISAAAVPPLWAAKILRYPSPVVTALFPVLLKIPAGHTATPPPAV